MMNAAIARIIELCDLMPNLFTKLQLISSNAIWRLLDYPLIRVLASDQGTEIDNELSLTTLLTQMRSEHPGRNTTRCCPDVPLIHQPMLRVFRLMFVDVAAERVAKDDRYDVADRGVPKPRMIVGRRMRILLANLSHRSRHGDMAIRIDRTR